MDAQRREAITEWDAREFSGGFAGIRRVAGDGFSGAVTDGTDWLFLVDGRVVEVGDADVDAFADTSGTAYEAPDDALPVLFAMQEAGSEPRAKYYTNDTPLPEADRKLSQGGFTGYIELSENVLSGDYHLVYTGGESMAAAFVGNARRLETGDEAFDLAADEVGIYTVYEVDLDARDLPDGGGSAVAGTGDAASAGDAPEDATDADDAVGPVAVDGAEDADDPGDTGGFDGDADPAGAGDVEGPGRAVDDAAPPGGDRGVADAGRPAPADGASRSSPADGGPVAADARPPGRAAGENRSAADSDDAPAGDPADVFSDEADWREQKSIPALDPSEASGPATDAPDDARSKRPRPRSRGDEASDGGSETARSAGGSAAPRSASDRPAASRRERERNGGTERVRELKAELQETEAERRSLADERDELADELDRLESEAEELREERDRLRGELSEARDRLPEADRTITPAAAREGTNLFVRYDSKEGATLADAHEGHVDREALRENLRIERHTSFETAGLAVDGRPFDEFLEATIEYGFTRWLVEDLPFEISGTGNEGPLRDLYDALPAVDRVEIGGTVSVQLRAGGEEVREQRAFDLVLRDRMGHPLFVADLNAGRDPTAEGSLESLVANGRDVAESDEAFAAAFAVTGSFFQPGALETASDAVGGGLFSRSKRASFVKLSRKRGYHLCLVEARDGGFHMTVPDL